MKQTVQKIQAYIAIGLLALQLFQSIKKLISQSQKAKTKV